MLPVLIDADPGVDDAMALVYAIRSGHFDIQGITVVAGNVPVAQGAENTARVLTALGRSDIPIAVGAAHPLLRPLHDASHVHGRDGLAGTAWPAPAVEPIALPAPLFLIERCLQAERPLTLIALGPLTNVALALATEPRIRHRLSRIVCMGGALFCPGNIAPAAEFNFFADPEAARMVLHAGVPLTMVGLDVTMRALLDPAAVARLAERTDPVARLIAEMGDHLCRLYRDWYDIAGTAIHDPLAVAAAADPTLLTTERYYVDVETQSPIALGQTVADRWRRTGRPPNVDAAVEVDAARFLDHFEAIVGGPS